MKSCRRMAREFDARIARLDLRDQLHAAMVRRVADALADYAMNRK